MALTIDFIPHLDAGDRDSWPGDQDERPLSDLGRRQAAALADALAGEAIDALYAGPALRCRQTLEVLAERLGQPIEVIPELGEKQAWRAPEDWNPDISSAAFAAGSLDRAVQSMRFRHPGGRVVACSHGHTIPAFAAYHMAAQGLPGVRPLPFEREMVLKYRGQWFRMRFEDDSVELERIEVPGFPR